MAAVFTCGKAISQKYDALMTGTLRASVPS